MMFRKPLTLFRMFGFAVRIDWSWIIILALVLWSLAGTVFPTQYPDLAWTTYLGMAFAAAFGLFASIVIHELCHSLVARRFGLPMKGITLFLFGGVAEMTDEPRSPKAELLMALAGPAASVAVAAVSAGIWALGTRAGWPVVVIGVFGWIALMNGLLAAFNMIPGFPLDGGRVLRAILWHGKRNFRQATHAASRVGMVFGIVLIVLGVLNLLALNPIGGLWWILIGMFLRGAARRAYQQVLFREALRGESVRRFMNENVVTVPPELNLDDLVEDYIYKFHYKMFPVVEDGRLLGCVSTEDVRDLERDEWPDRTVRDMVQSCGESNAIAPDADAMDALARMSRTGTSRMLVVDDGRLAGILTLKDLMEFLSLKLELEGDDFPTRPSLGPGEGALAAPESREGP
jgi:Zn-dependent protease/predicted transcriptional regulator